MKAISLQSLIDDGRLWKGGSSPEIAIRSSGFQALDQSLAGGGWPAHMLIEILTSSPEELPMQCILKTWQLHQDERWYVLVNPPYQPCAEGLIQANLKPEQIDLIRANPKDTSWCLEQMAGSPAIASILAWGIEKIRTPQLRRLQLACQQARTQLFLIRPLNARANASPAPLRAQLHKIDSGFTIEIFKQPAANAHPIIEIKNDLEWLLKPAPAMRKIVTQSIHKRLQ
ncbi:hypothetical protein N8Y93_00200 [Litorivicinus sp.]|jgi:protein ImuA|nr:hypothetical protein [Litorivicinus sp.]|tara:strand:+ start:2214 stop:2897 length:684 start_codon:yes stop_codon:yes gene_type:complete